jgi:hypothetical protein
MRTAGGAPLLLPRRVDSTWSVLRKWTENCKRDGVRTRSLAIQYLGSHSCARAAYMHCDVQSRVSRIANLISTSQPTPTPVPYHNIVKPHPEPSFLLKHSHLHPELRVKMALRNMTAPPSTLYENPTPALSSIWRCIQMQTHSHLARTGILYPM